MLDKAQLFCISLPSEKQNALTRLYKKKTIV